VDKDAIADELDQRIAVDRKHFGGQLPERVAIAWRGYCAGLLEWGVIDVKHHDRLLQSLPDIENDPVRDILLGREDSSD
jgi:hypothetical protein